MAVSWTQQSTPTAFNNTWRSVAWSPDLNLFCAVGAVNGGGNNSHRIMTSPDGVVWTAQDSGVTAANTWSSVCWAGGTIQKFVATKQSGTDRIAYSADGINWTHVGVDANIWNDVAYSEDLDRLVAVASSGVNRTMYSDDGIAWTPVAAASAKSWAGLVWASGISKFVAIHVNASDPILMYSADGTSWTGVNSPFGAQAPTGLPGRGIAWSETLGLLAIVMSNNDNPVWTAPDATGPWTQQTIPTTGANRPVWRGITYASGDIESFLVVATKGLTNANQILLSSDGANWLESDPGVATVEPWLAAAYSPDLNLFAVISDNTTNDGLSAMTATGVSVTPAIGNSFGGTAVTITGNGLNGNFYVPASALTVHFDVSNFINPTFLADITPQKYFKGNGLSLTEVTDLGEIATINATRLGYAIDGGDFGEATNVVVVDPTTLTAVTSKGIGLVPVAVFNTTSSIAVGEYSVQISAGDIRHLNLAFYLDDAFTYANPEIISLTPTSGPSIGGTPVTITGQYLFQDEIGHIGNVYFGDGLATDLVFVNSTTLTCVTPAYNSTSNPVDVHFDATSLGLGPYPRSTIDDAFTYTTTWIELEDELKLDAVIPLLQLVPPDACTFPLTSFLTESLTYLATGSVGNAVAAMGLANTYPSCISCQILALLWGIMGLRGEDQLAETLATAFPSCNFPKLSKFFFPPGAKPLQWDYEAISTPNDKGWWLSVTDKFNGAALLVNNAIPRNPRTFTELSPFATGTAGMMGGFPGPSAVWNNRLVYAKGGYTVGTDRPPVHLFDGQFDRQIAEVPETSGGAVPKAVVSMLSANGTIYLSTLDSGSDDSTWVGRVFELDVENAQLFQIGDTFATGHVPYALAWHAGRLWCGTMKQDPTNSGKLYSFRPDLTTTWTQELDLASVTQGGVTSLLSFEGLLYVGCSADTGTFAKVLVRGVDTTYTTSLTATGGVAAENNAFLAMVAWEDNLYASYWNPDTPTKVSKIYKFDGTTWTTVFTASSTASRIPYIGFPQDEDTLLAIGGGLTYDAQLRSTTNGTTWNDRSTFLTQGSPNATGVPVFGTVVR